MLRKKIMLLTYSCNSGIQSNKLMLHGEHGGLNQMLLRVKTMVIYIYIDAYNWWSYAGWLASYLSSCMLILAPPSRSNYEIEHRAEFGL